MSQPLYKVVSADVWQAAITEGRFRGAGIDLQDGFIHLSAANQVEETVALHFVGVADLVLVTIDEDTLAESDLRWESSRGGDLFPHVYGEIDVANVLRVDPLPLAEDGQHQFPFDPANPPRQS